MPLLKGSGKKVVGKNIKEMIKSGKKPKQAIASALSQSRKSNQRGR